MRTTITVTKLAMCGNTQNYEKNSPQQNLLGHKKQNHNKQTTRNPKIIWEKPRRHSSRQRITTSQSPRWLQRNAQHISLLQNCLFPFNDLHPIKYINPSTDPLTTPNGIQIQSTVFPQFTYRTDRQTDKHNDRQMV